LLALESFISCRAIKLLDEVVLDAPSRPY